METICQVSKPDVQEIELELPPGFRFHPSDEELITHYLTPKVMDISFSAIAIGEVDFNKVEPWDLPWKAKMGEKEWYFFCMKDRKYPTGSRTNRATGAGYWKATGKDKDIFRVKKLVGMKKTLVFYKGRAPKGEKTNWVMHEYRLEGTQSSKTSKNEWVISRIFKKSSGGKKVHISGLLRTSNNNSDDSEASYLPSLMDLCSDDQISKSIMTVDSSSFLEDKKPFDNISINDFSMFFPKVLSQNCFSSSSQFIMPYVEQKDSCFLQEESILRMLLEQNNNGQGSKQQNAKVEISGDTDMSSSPLSNHDGNLRAYGYGDQEFPVITSGPVDLDCLWNC